MDQTKMDCLPNIEHIIKMAELFEKTKGGLNVFDWNRDQNKDFYMGMFCAMRIFQSGVIRVKSGDYGGMEELEMECMFRLGEIATIIMEKYDLNSFKS